MRINYGRKKSIMRQNHNGRGVKYCTKMFINKETIWKSFFVWIFATPQCQITFRSDLDSYIDNYVLQEASHGFLSVFSRYFPTDFYGGKSKLGAVSLFRCV